MGLRDVLKRLAQHDGGRERRGFFAASVSDEDVTVAPDATWMLRNSERGFWVALRARLTDEGIDPETTAVAESFEEGPTTRPEEVGVAVSADERVVEYRYSYVDENWVRWEDITGTWQTSRHSGAVAKAVLMGPDETGPIKREIELGLRSEATLEELAAAVGLTLGEPLHEREGLNIGGGVYFSNWRLPEPDPEYQLIRNYSEHERDWRYDDRRDLTYVLRILTATSALDADALIERLGTYGALGRDHLGQNAAL